MPQNDQQESIVVRRAKCDSLTIYEVPEGDREIIKKGADSTLFNIAIALIGICISFLITIWTVDITSDRKYNFFLFVAILTGLGGVILIILRAKGGNTFKQTIEKIEKRIKEDIQADTSTDPNTIEVQDI